MDDPSDLENTVLETVHLLDSKSSQKTQKMKGKCKSLLNQYLPITIWLPQYSFHKLMCDMVAGITVGFMVIPQGIAYASIAGLEPVYGLYCAFMGCFVYCVFGTSKDVTVGPTAITSLFVAQYCHLSKIQNQNLYYAVALSFFSGIIQFVLGFFRLGFVVRFISVPVVSGFTSSAAIIIAVGQVKSLLGLSNIREPFFDCVYDTFKHIGETRTWDLVLGCCCILILLVLRFLGTTQWPDDNKDVAVKQRVARKIIWLFSTGRNAVVVLIASLVAYAFVWKGHGNVFSLTTPVHQGLPNFEVPRLRIPLGNHTRTTLEVLSDLGPGLIIVPLIGFLQSIAIAKAFARKNKYNVYPSQELIALGLANFLSSFVSSFPVTGCFSRTAVHSQSGVTTQAGSLFTGAVVLLALGALTPYFQYIPKASLAALIISAILTMVDYRITLKIWRTNKIELVPLFVTFFGCFYRIEVGILCGIGVSLVIFLYPIIWPELIRVERDYTVIKVNGELVYAGMEYITSEIQDIVCSDPPPRGVIVDMNIVTQIDFTVTQSLLVIIEDLENRHIALYFSGVQDHIRDTMANSGIDLSIINPSPDLMTGAINN